MATEPAGPAGLKPALGGFSLGVNAQSSDAKKAASWLFIQWVTSEEMAKPYIEAGGVSGRTRSTRTRTSRSAIRSWPRWSHPGTAACPTSAPASPSGRRLSEVVAEWGTRMMLGNVSIEQGAQSIGARMEEILGQAGYYDGSKPLRK